MQQDQTPVNFDFINQQPASKQKKGMQTRVKVLIVLVPIAVLMLIASFVFGRNQEQAAVSQQETVSVPDQFISAMTADNESYLAETYPLLADSLKENESIAVSALERIYESVDFGTCTDGEKITSGNIVTANYSCQTRSGDPVALEVISDGKVTAYRVK